MLLVVLLAASTQLGHAQSIAAGTVSLGGSVGYSRTSNESSFAAVSISGNTRQTLTTTTTNSQFSFSPAAGYFVANNLEVGLDLGYTAARRSNASYLSTPNTGPELDPSTTLRLGVFGRYYKMLVEQFGLTGMLGGGYQTLHDQFYNNGSNGAVVNYKATGYYAALTPGIIFFPIAKLGISASMGSLGYSRLSSEGPVSLFNPPPYGSDKTTTFGARFGLDQLQFGGTYYFGR